MPTIGSTATAPVPQLIDGGVQTGAFTAVAGSTYQINYAASLGAQVINLPTAPPQGTLIAFDRIDTNFYTSFPTLTPGGGDTMDGGLGSFNLAGGGLLLLYQGTSWRLVGWGTAGLSGQTGVSSTAAFPPSIMARDTNGRSQVADPAATADVATRNYVDTRGAVQAPSYAAYGSTNILVGQFDPRRSIYNWKSSNTRWLRRGLALAARGGKSDQLVIGDSISAGAVSGIGTTVYDRPNAWPMAMRNALAGMGVPIGGTGIVRPQDAAQVDARYTSTGTWSGNNVYTFSTVVGATLTFTPDLSGSMFEVLWIDGTSASYTISVNGVVVRTVTGSAVTAVKRIRVTGQSIVANQTKITVTVTTAGTGCIIAGMNVFTPNSGLIVHNVAQTGSRASGSTGNNSWTDIVSTGTNSSPYATFGDSAGRSRQVTDAGFTAASVIMTSASSTFTIDDIGKPVDMMAVPTTGIVLPENTYIVSINSTTSVNLNVAAYVTATAQTVTIDRDPHVVHLAIGGNDMLNGLTVANTVAALTTLRNRYPNSDVILHLFHNVSTTLQTQVVQDSFATAYYQLADTLDIPLFDWRDRIGTYAQAQANGVMGDYQVHLKGSGYAMIGSLLAEVIGESSGKTQGVFTPTQDTDFTNKNYVDTKDVGNGVNPAAQSLATAGTAVYVTPQLKIPANTAVVGDTWRFTLSLSNSAIAALTPTGKVGAAGTTADTSITGPTLAAGNATGGWAYLDVLFTVRTLGSSGVLMVTWRYNGVAAFSSTQATARNGTATINTTVDQFIGVAAASSVSGAISVDTAISEIVRKA